MSRKVVKIVVYIMIAALLLSSFATGLALIGS